MRLDGARAISGETRCDAFGNDDCARGPLAISALGEDARPTSAATVAITKRVLGRVFVAMDAMGLGRLTAPANVLEQRDRLEVLGVAAVPNPAEMVEREPAGNRADEGFVGDAVNDARTRLHADLSVPSLLSAACPQPAAGLGVGEDPLLDPLAYITRVPHETVTSLPAPLRVTTSV